MVTASGSSGIWSTWYARKPDNDLGSFCHLPSSVDASLLLMLTFHLQFVVGTLCLIRLLGRSEGVLLCHKVPLVCGPVLRKM